MSKYFLANSKSNFYPSQPAAEEAAQKLLVELHKDKVFSICVCKEVSEVERKDCDET